MLAAFPPPAQAQTDRQSRGSWFRTTSWPLAPSRQGEAPSRSGLRDMTPSDEGQGKRRRRCCGLPIWGFILVMILLACIIAAAVVIPLEFFVFKNLGNHDKPKTELAQCQESLTCQNGGTNVLSEGVCSCICTNGFMGSDCSTGGSDGCTTTDLGGNLSNVTLGQAIPRLIEDGQSNFSIPLSGTAILAKFNSESLSCIAQNALVSFDGATSRTRNTASKVDTADDNLETETPDLAARAPSVITVSSATEPDSLLVDEGTPTAVPTATGDDEDATQTSEAGSTGTDGSPSPTTTFTVTGEVLDFARVAVLYVLQKEDVDSANDAQSSIRSFLAKANKESGVPTEAAANIEIGENKTVDLLRYKIDLGSGAIGGNSKRDMVTPQARQFAELETNQVSRRGGSLIPRC
ncbi:hypothetical protein NM208_g15899 [Fusarium decemcellulare]|uniref:Uncharacterized protein n=1 Tax=Fusarium decemcellulare TaxID=57161 RepID=A0ACC1RF44_9HYPO|nr:hypothetical protein NM208_g15899 [Fusarium decemcellulare]